MTCPVCNSEKLWRPAEIAEAGRLGIVVVCSPECLAELESVGATWFLNQKRRENGLLPVPKRYR